MLLHLLLLSLVGPIYASYKPVPSRKYTLKDTGTGNYLVLLGDQTDIRNNRGAERSYIDPVRNFTTVTGFRPGLSSDVGAGDSPTKDQGEFIFRSFGDNDWLIEHANTGRYLLAPDQDDIRDKRCGEWGWLKASGTRAADANYYGLANFKLRIWSTGLFLEHGRSGRYVMAAGEKGSSGSAVNADCNYYWRALWTIQ